MEESAKAPRIEIVCPCCQAEIVVDRETGTIIHHVEKRSEGRPDSIAQIMEGLAAKKESSEKLFEREMSSMKDRGRLLEEKLQEAMRRAKEQGDEKPVRPIDLD